MKNSLSREEMLAQIRVGKEIAVKMYAEDTPRLRAYIMKLKTPINFHDVVEIYNGLYRNQITVDNIATDVLEEFKLTRQYRSLLKKNKILSI